MSYPKYAYKLSWEVDHFEDFLLPDFDNEIWRNDLWIEEWNDYSSTLDSDIKLFEHPTPIVYKGEIAVVKHIDFPYTDNGWLVMSKKMLEVLKSVGDFSHREIPVIIKQGLTYNVMKEWYLKDGNLSDEGALTNYVFVQFTQYTDVFDREKSIFKVSDLVPNRINYAEEHVFRIPSGSLPPIFKIPESPVSTFISGEAREALQKAGISGTAYYPLNGIKASGINSDLVDVPVKIPKDWMVHRISI
jgi:hypothetical protein